MAALLAGQCAVVGWLDSSRTGWPDLDKDARHVAHNVTAAVQRRFMIDMTSAARLLSSGGLLQSFSCPALIGGLALIHGGYPNPQDFLRRRPR